MTEANETKAVGPVSQMTMVPIGDIKVNHKLNARGGGKPIDTTTDDYKNLAASIADRGVIEPIILGLAVKGTNAGKFVLMAGFRRYTAAKEVGLTSLPAVIRPIEDDVELRVINLIENVQREDLHQADLAVACASLKKEHGLKQKDIAEMVRLTPGYLSSLINLAEKLDPFLIKKWREADIPYEILRKWMDLEPAEQKAALKRYMSKGDDAEGGGGGGGESEGAGGAEDDGKKEPKPVGKAVLLEVMDALRGAEDMKVRGNWDTITDAERDKLMVLIKFVSGRYANKKVSSILRTGAEDE